MKKEELKKYVNEYFKRYMCVETLDKFVEHWEETSNAIEYFRKENEQLQSIIKEVRDLVNKEEFTMKQKYEMREELLEILDKVEENSK